LFVPRSSVVRGLWFSVGRPQWPKNVEFADEIRKENVNTGSRSFYWTNRNPASAKDIR